MIGAIFAHAPIILPAVSGLPFRFLPAPYVAGLLVLHVSVVLRVGGSLIEVTTLRSAAGLLHVVALVLLAAAIAAGLTRGRWGSRVDSKHQL